MNRLVMNASTPIADTVSSYTCKQSLQAFLPSRVAALSHVVERIGSLAMTTADRLVEAARQRNLKLLKELAWDLRFDVLTVVAAATKETPKTLDAIGSCFRDWTFVGALHNAKQLDTIKLLYRWIKGREKMNALPSMLQIAATQGSFDILEFASERIVVEFLGKDPDKWLTRRERRRKLSKIVRVLQTFQSVQRWFHRAFYSAFRKGHRDFADRIYATYPSYPACIKDKLFQTAMRVGWVEIVKFIFCKGRINAEASNRAFKGPADCRRCDILAFLLENADISVESVEGHSRELFVPDRSTWPLYSAQPSESSQRC